MNQYDTIIIGAGIAGLTAAKELASNNLKPLVVEKNLLPTDKSVVVD
ncbi:MAG: FAD-dependent oxidoreductase [Anaerolineaceae bacterium]|nr:FAD-dependent oxidoreductase [Anaerolineaceae bacterium]